MTVKRLDGKHVAVAGGEAERRASLFATPSVNLSALLGQESTHHAVTSLRSIRQRRSACTIHLTHHGAQTPNLLGDASVAVHYAVEDRRACLVVGPGNASGVFFAQYAEEITLSARCHKMYRQFFGGVRTYPFGA
jgi:hypothetical protein